MIRKYYPWQKPFNLNEFPNHRKAAQVNPNFIDNNFRQWYCFCNKNQEEEQHLPTTEQKDQSSDASEIREKLLEIGKKLSDGEDAMLELKTLLEENNLGINADSNLLTVTWVLDQLIYGLDIHFGEGLSVREECKPSLETYARQLNQSIGDYIADALGSNPSIVAMANMIDALFQLYNFAASAIEPAHP